MFAAVHAPSGADPARLVECASDFSPYVEEAAPATVTISIDGLAHLFGSAREIAEAIARHAEELGLAVHVAVAPNPDLAVHGALGFPGVSVMEPGNTACLPVEILEPPPGIADTLALWGIRTFGDFAALPADGVAGRLGPLGAHLQKLARGEGSRPLVPSNPAPRFQESLELEYPVTLIEPLSFVLGRLTGALCARLESHGLATHELRLALTLEGSDSFARTLRLPYPMRDARVFLKLMTLDIEQHPPPAPVTAVTLTAEPVNPRVVQHGLFIPLAPEPQKLELTLARIAKLVGEENVGCPQRIDTHRPRAFRMRRFGMKKSGDIPGWQRKTWMLPRTQGCPPDFSLRVFRPAIRAQVLALKGWPLEIFARGVRGRVLDAAGPWRTSGDWWREDAWSRDEWDVALSDGALYLLYRDRRDGQWFVEGAYD
jgi:protein ImuB